MTIEEVKNDKKSLEAQLEVEIEKFQHRTGTLVDKIEIFKDNYGVTVSIIAKIPNG